MKKLNIGCGDQKMPGYINVDISAKCKPDAIWDATSKEIPRKLMNADYIRCDNICEHLEPQQFIDLMNNFREMLNEGGRLWLRVPGLNVSPLVDEKDLFKRFNTLLKQLDGVFTDPTHRNQFTNETLLYWDGTKPRCKIFGKDYGIIPWKMIRCGEWKNNNKFLICEMEKL